MSAFAVSSFYGGLAGALLGYYLQFVNPDNFGLGISIGYIAMIIVGGMGSLVGSMVGAAIWLLLPSIINLAASQAGDTTGLVHLVLVEHKAQLVQLIFGCLVMVLLIFAPQGLAGLGQQWFKRRSSARSKVS